MDKRVKTRLRDFQEAPALAKYAIGKIFFFWRPETDFLWKKVINCVHEGHMHSVNSYQAVSNVCVFFRRVFTTAFLTKCALIRTGVHLFSYKCASFGCLQVDQTSDMDKRIWSRS